MPSYDLRTEPWIPVQFTSGSTGSVGLRDALVRAHEIREIALDNPMETAALYRLLLALAVRIHPETEDQDRWFDLWDRGEFDPAPIDAYFETWKDRFDLFHPERPFYQVRENAGQSILPVCHLKHDEGKNTSSLFSHDDLKQGKTMTPAEAARGVVANQHADPGGLLSNPYKTGNKNTPAIGGAIFWICGDNLIRSLMLNAPPIPDARMGGRRQDDAPAWEHDASPTQQNRPHIGLLDALTFQHRRITLEVRENDDGVVVTGFRRTGGNAEEPMPMNDPHMATLAADPRLKLEPRRYNIQAGKAAWRDASIYLTLRSERGTPPPTFQWVQANRDDLAVTTLHVDLYALRTRGANDGTIKLWRSERLPLHLNLLADPSRGDAVTLAMERAERQGRNLNGAVMTTARTMLSNGSDQVANLARSIDAVGRYWSALESAFYRLLEQLATAPDPDLNPDWSSEPMRGWSALLHRTALSAFERATASFNRDARQLRAVALGRNEIRPVSRYRTSSSTQSAREVAP